jgi:dipeptidyl aminopeptidase/acylaminoacyl peptidase
VYLAGESLVDGDRVIITGGSAGGHTTLADLAFDDAFSAGASYHGWPRAGDLPEVPLVRSSSR